MSKKELNENVEVVEVEDSEVENNNETLVGLDKVLSIEDILAKKDECKKRKQQKRCYVYSKFLGGKLEAHQLSKSEIRDVMNLNPEKRDRAFIFRSIDYLRDKRLIDGFDRKRNSDMIVEDIFYSPVERSQVMDILLELNGLIGLDDNAIMKVEIEELQGE